MSTRLETRATRSPRVARGARQAGGGEGSAVLALPGRAGRQQGIRGVAAPRIPAAGERMGGRRRLAPEFPEADERIAGAGGHDAAAPSCRWKALCPTCASRRRSFPGARCSTPRPWTSADTRCRCWRAATRDVPRSWKAIPSIRRARAPPMCTRRRAAGSVRSRPLADQHLWRRGAAVVVVRGRDAGSDRGAEGGGRRGIPVADAGRVVANAAGADPNPAKEFSADEVAPVGAGEPRRRARRGADGLRAAGGDAVPAGERGRGGLARRRFSEQRLSRLHHAHARVGEAAQPGQSRGHEPDLRHREHADDFRIQGGPPAAGAGVGGGAVRAGAGVAAGR